MPVIRDYEGPVYIRLHRKALPDVFPADYRFDLFSADTIREGRDVTIFASGILVQESLQALELLKQEGIEAELINIHTIKPIDADLIAASAAKTGHVVTCEEHSVIGGLGSAVCDVLAERCPTPVRKVGVNDVFGESGPAVDLLHKYGLDAAGVERAVRELLA